MSSYITLSHIKVQGANCVAGITYGFPTVSSFLGFVHALSRKLSQSHKVSLNGCGIVSHDAQVLKYKTEKFSDNYFSQTKNPSAFQHQQKYIGGTPPIIEEGKMHMTVSLVIKCTGFNGTDEDKKDLENHIKNLCLTQKLSGGIITNIQDVIYENIMDESGFYRLQRRLVPGFVLMDHSDYLNEHYLELQKQDENKHMIDAWLDFCAIKFKAKPILKNGEDLTNKTRAVWEQQPKPYKRFLVPLLVGYQAISELYDKGVVENSRNPEYPFCFTEAIYGIGEWLNPQRIENIENIIWKYQYMHEKYLCTQEQYINESIEGITDDIDEIDEIFFNN